MKDQCCDFCGEREVSARYRTTQSYQTIGQTEHGELAMLIPESSWLACPKCSRAIDTGNTDALEVASTIKYLAEYDVDASDLHGLSEEVKTIHALFWYNRTGEKEVIA